MGNINAMIAIVNTHPINAWLRLGLRIDSNVRIRCEMQSQIIPGKPKISVNFSFWPICFCLWLVLSCYFVFKRFSFYYLIPKSSVWNLIRTFVLWSKFATVTHTKKNTDFILRSTTETPHKFHTAHLCILFFYLHFILHQVTNYFYPMSVCLFFCSSPEQLFPNLVTFARKRFRVCRYFNNISL